MANYNIDLMLLLICVQQYIVYIRLEKITFITLYSISTGRGGGFGGPGGGFGGGFGSDSNQYLPPHNYHK